MAYATVDQLAAQLRIRVTPENTPVLQRCLDAAAIEIDHYIARDAATDPPVPVDDPLAGSVNLRRAGEWFKSQDSMFGVVGAQETGELQAPRMAFGRRHADDLSPLKTHWGVA